MLPSSNIVASLVFLVVLPLILLQRCGAADGNTARYYEGCSTSGNFSRSSTYELNLGQLLAMLPSNAIDNSGSYNGTAGTAPDAVFAVAMCHADSPWPDHCESCLQTATAGVTSACPSSKNASAGYQGCVVRYSDTPIASLADTGGVAYFTVNHAENVPQFVEFQQTRTDLFTALSGAASVSPTLLASGNRTFNGTHTLYGLAQCSKYLPADECSTCIRSLAATVLPATSLLSQGVSVTGFSCYIRYDLQPFRIYDFGATAQQVPVAAPIDELEKDGSVHHAVHRAEIIAIVVSTTIIALLVVIMVARHYIRKSHEEELMALTGLRRYSSQDIKQATENFSAERKLGKGGFGEVYRGNFLIKGESLQEKGESSKKKELSSQKKGESSQKKGESSQKIEESPQKNGESLQKIEESPQKNGQSLQKIEESSQKNGESSGKKGESSQELKELAVKRVTDQAAAKELFRELWLLATLVHRNVVRLEGFCMEGGWSCLGNNGGALYVCNELMSGSLDKYIFDFKKDGRKPLCWSIRYKIIRGICDGLEYLHGQCNKIISHMDIKPNNILLDNDMIPKIADLGLSRVFEKDHTRVITTKVIGSYGYIAPEYARHGEVGRMCDIYSLGVLILAIVLGRGTIDNSDPCGREFVRESRSKFNNAMKDETQLKKEAALNVIDGDCLADVKNCIAIALACAQEYPKDRLKADRIVSYLRTNDVDPTYVAIQIAAEENMAKES